MYEDGLNDDYEGYSYQLEEEEEIRRKRKQKCVK